jgi:3-hydroxyisobutyrate dehydrogenase
MSRIAFLGLGAMGSRMVAHLISAGHDVIVWNRSTATVDATVALGARAAATPREATEGATFALTMLTDDEASKAVWTADENAALVGLGKEAIAIEISTVSPDWVKTLAAAVEERGARFLDAPVVGSLPQAEAAQLIMLVGGAVEAFAAARPLLGNMAGTVHHVGPQGQGTIMKLAANALLAIQVTGVAETLVALDRAGITPKRAMEIIGSLPFMSPAGNSVASLMVAEDYAPRFTTTLIAKDLRYATTDAASHGARVPVLEAARAIFDRLCTNGVGGENISAAIKAYRD